MRTIVITYLTCILVNLLDSLSSLGFNDQFLETNPLMRDEQGVFVLSYSLIVKGLVILALMAFSWLVYHICVEFDHGLAIVLACALPAWVTWSAGQAALGNLFLHLKWHHYL